MRLRILPVALLAIGALVACGSDEPDTDGRAAAVPSQATSSGPGTTASETPAAGEHNAVDVMFAQQMIPHHAQAVEMGDLAVTRAESADVKRMAAQIKAAQAPEIEQMTAWLQSWGEPVKRPGAPSGHMEMMPGMMTEAEMTELQGLSGRAFDREFLDMMIRHHEGAVTMSEMLLKNGQNAEAKQLGTSIQDSQRKEIAEMRTMLAAL